MDTLFHVCPNCGSANVHMDTKVFDDKVVYVCLDCHQYFTAKKEDSSDSS